VISGALDELDPLSRQRIEALFADQLTAGVLNIGRDYPSGEFFGRKLRAVTDPHGPSFTPAEQAKVLSA
jgi:hypothetical protein